MRTMAVVNHKGGSGKTTAAVNIAAALGERGSRVVLIDLDPQCSATRWLGYEPPSDQGLSRVLANGAGLHALVVPTDIAGVELVPGDEWLEIAERRDFDGAAIPQLVLKQALAASTIPCDIVMIDTPGRLSLLTVAALAAVEEALVPIPAGAMELDHVTDLQDTITEVSRINPGLRVPYLMPWSVDDRTVLARDVVGRLRQEFADQVSPTPVRRTVRAAEAFAHRQPLTQFAPHHPVTDDLRSVAVWLREGLGHVTDEARVAG